MLSILTSMSGLSRRSFLGTVAALSAAWGIPATALGAQLAATPTTSEALSTLDRTIRLGPVQRGSFRRLVAAAGEKHAARVDLLGRPADAGRSSRRRSLFYCAHLSDIHVIDAQSPARLEPLVAISPSLFQGAFRPQDTLTTHVGAEMVRSVAGLRISQVTGAPLAAAFVTGDSADQVSQLETRWYINLMDGTPFVANSGAPSIYEGVQAWQETPWAYHPADPTNDVYGNYGFPRVPGLLEAAVSVRVGSGGLPTPWYSVYGNHDTLYMGTFGIPAGIKEFALGRHKYFSGPGVALNYVQDWAADAAGLTRLWNFVSANVGTMLGTKTVTPDPARKILEQEDFMRAHFETTPHPGPVGHGFTKENLTTGKTYWSADVGPFIRIFGLDTCNQVAGPDGAVPEKQFTWLRDGLTQAERDGRLVMVLSHHNSFTLENTAELPTQPQRLVHADELVSLLLSHPNVVAWLNGHTHNSTITPHARSSGAPGGFWEITTASCVDFPQQQQVVEIVDNRDGTLSLFTTVLDHDAPPEWNGDLTSTGLASLSRQLAANDWRATPVMRIGSLLDRNTELLLPAPPVVTSFTDAQVQSSHAVDFARVMSWERGW